MFVPLRGLVGSARGNCLEVFDGMTSAEGTSLLSEDQGCQNHATAALLPPSGSPIFFKIAIFSNPSFLQCMHLLRNLIWMTPLDQPSPLVGIGGTGAGGRMLGRFALHRSVVIPCTISTGCGTRRVNLCWLFSGTVV